MKPTKRMIAEKQALLDQWVQQFETNLSDFIEYAPADKRMDLSFSCESLDVIESWLLDRYASGKALVESDRSEDLIAKGWYRGAKCYACEVYRRHLPGSYWSIHLEDTASADFGNIKLHGPEDYPFEEFPPLPLAVQKRTGTVLRERLERTIDWAPGVFRGKRRPTRIKSEHLKVEWLAEIHEAVDYFLEWAPPELSSKLDFSPESLDVIEGWIRERCQDGMHISIGKHPEITDGAARYVGEVFRRSFGGSWDIVLDNARFKNKYLPLVKGTTASPYQFCPLHVIWTAVDFHKQLLLKKEFLKNASGKR